jgi:OOP family OmpA-OmpF porin
MKKTLAISAFILSLHLAGQTWERRWNAGVHGGFSQYSGDIGNGFYKLNQAAYSHIGFSVSRYLTRHIDATLLFTRGEVGYVEYNPQPDQPRGHFVTRQTTLNVLLRYSFLNPEKALRPYVFVGTGLNWMKGYGIEYSSGRNPDISIPAFGAGINWRITPIINLQLQEMFIYTSSDNIDLAVGGMNDMFLLHTVGLTFNFGKNKHGLTGVGERIDECPKVNNDSAKLKKEGGKARKPKKKSKR